MDALDAVMTALHKLQGIHSPSLLAEDQQPFLEAKEALRLWLAEATAPTSGRSDWLGLDCPRCEGTGTVFKNEIAYTSSQRLDAKADESRADYCPGYCARGEPHNGPHDPVVLHRQSGGQTAEAFTNTPSQRVDAATVERVKDAWRLIKNELGSGLRGSDGYFYPEVHDLSEAIAALATEPHQHGGKGA